MSTQKTLVRDSAPIEIKRKKRTAEGFLDVWGVAAKVGAMDYPEHGFTAYVPAETLRESAPLLVGQPVTVEHPEDGVTPDNARHTVVGTVLESTFDEDSGEQRVHLRLYDAEAIALVEGDEKAELSPGYDVSYADADEATRAEHGADKIQTGRLPNHLALTEAARGGPSVRLNIDSKGADVPKTKTTDAEGQPSGNEMKDAETPPEPPTKDADKPPMFDAAKMKGMYDALKGLMDMLAPMMGGEESEAEDAEKPPEAPPMKDSAPTVQSSVERFMRARDAAAALGLDVSAHGYDLAAIEGAVASSVLGEEQAKQVKPAEMRLVVDTALRLADRAPRIGDLNPRKTGDSSEQRTAPALSPEAASLDIYNRAARPSASK